MVQMYDDEKKSMFLRLIHATKFPFTEPDEDDVEVDVFIEENGNEWVEFSIKMQNMGDSIEDDWCYELWRWGKEARLDFHVKSAEPGDAMTLVCMMSMLEFKSVTGADQ